MNEYETLLSYLDKQERPGFKPKKNVTQVKSFEDITIKDEPKVEVSSTKQIIEECQEKKSIDTPRITNSSIGFDVDKFENLMRTRLIDDYKKLQSYERPYISVTELFYCLRKSYYTRLKYSTNLKEQFNFAYLDIINRLGNTIHDYVQEIYNFVEVEKTIVSEKYKTKGRCDAITQPFLYEIKTLDEKKFPGIYLKEHYYQPIIYAYLLNTEYNYNIQTITLIYFFRDNIKRKPYTIDLPLDNKIAVGFLEQSLLLQNSLVSKKVPDPFNATQEQCRWCPYKSYCEKDSSAIGRPFDSKMPKQKEVNPFKDTEVEEVIKKSKSEAKFLL